MKNRLQVVLVLLSVLTLTQLSAQVHLTALNTSYSQDFNTLASAGTVNDSSTVPSGWVFLEMGTNANFTYAAGTGSSTTGNTYSLGLDADRTFGGLQSGSLIPVVGARFINNTSATITQLQISYTGEQWRLGATPRTQGDRLDFQYSVNASSLSSGTWTDDDSLDFSSPVLSGTVGALNGNAVANKRLRHHVISGLSIPAGATFWIRWIDFNVAGSDDALGVDDFSIMPAGVPSNQPAIVLSPPALNFGQVTVNTAKVLSYTVTISNLTDSLLYINTFTPDFTLSLDQVNYNDSIILTHSDTVFVKFSPQANGPSVDSALHYSSGISKAVHLSGSGYDPLSNIISIAEARGKTAGVTVTIAGRVTVAHEQGSPSFVQDATGGIPVFDFPFSNAVSIGDSVIVTGAIGFFNNQVQISSNISFVQPDSTKRFIAPKPIAVGELAANEGLLVTVQQVSLVNKAFVFYPQSTEQITNGTVRADLRIDGDTDIPGLTKPQGVVDITGVVGRFKTNAQLLPRFRADIPGAAEPRTPFDSIPKTETFDLMNWNLEFFGAIDKNYPQGFGPPNETLQLENVRRVIDSVHADVIAVQEVSNDSIFNALIRELPGYKAVCSNRYSHSFDGPDATFPPQKVCVIYDSTTVHVQSTRVMFQNLYDSARLFNPLLIPNYPTGDASSFWSSGRLPFMVTANVTINGVTERIRFIDIHAKSGDQQSDYGRRVYDAGVLKDSLDAHYATDKIVILGDYNDDLRQSIVTGLPTSYLSFVQDTSRYNPITRTLSFAGAKSTVSFDGVIDNQIISNELNAEYLDGSERVITPFLEVANYGTTTSDHLPVLSRFEFKPVTAFITTPSIGKLEANDSVRVEVALSSLLTTDKTLSLSIHNGPGVVYGADYITLPTPGDSTLNIVIPAGSTTASVWIRIKDDMQDELDETVTLRLLPSAGVQVAGAHSTFTLIILDNDAATLKFAVAAISREEGSGAYTVKLNLSTPQNQNQTVTIQTRDGQGVYYGSILDYTTTPAVSHGKILLVIPAGKTEAEFYITPNRDLLRENNETITFTITSISGGIVAGNVSTSVFTILDVPVCLPVYTVFPNPTFGVVKIYTLPENEGTIISGSLLDAQGHTLAFGNGTAEQLGQQFTSVLESRRLGVYIVRLTACDTVITVRILKL